MTDTNPWLDALPPGSPERQLLVAGKAARPPDGAADLGWQALTVALGAAAATATVTTKAVATAAMASNTTSAASATVASKVVAGGLGFSLGAKSVAIGFAVGIGLLGTTTLVERVTERSAAPALSARVPTMVPVVARRVPSQQALGALTAETVSEAAHLPNTLQAAPRATKTGPTSTEPETTSLANQARELAQVKRLLDAGGTTEALHRLESSFVNDVHSALAQERDALYVEALEKSQRRSQAAGLAQRFLARYPNSPHAEKMRKLIASE